MNTLQSLMAKSDVPPRSIDLTVDKIVKAMSVIKPGDLVNFDSYKGCNEACGVARSNSIRTKGEVIENCGGYLMIKLPKGIIESVNYFDIYAVNGLRFHGYSPKEF